MSFRHTDTGSWVFFFQDAERHKQVRFAKILMQTASSFTTGGVFDFFSGSFRWTASTSLEMVVGKLTKFYSVIQLDETLIVSLSTHPVLLMAVQSGHLRKCQVFSKKTSQSGCPETFLQMFGWSCVLIPFSWDHKTSAPHECMSIVFFMLSQSGKSLANPQANEGIASPGFSNPPKHLWLVFMTVFFCDWGLHLYNNNISRLTPLKKHTNASNATVCRYMSSWIESYDFPW